MKKIIQIAVLFIATATFSQAGHLMAGIGSINSSMGGAATGQPIDINGALQWNPAAISNFDHNILSVDLGLFFASPKLSSSLSENMMFPDSPAVSGETTDNMGASPMPAIGMVWGKPDSNLTFGASIFGVSGFGVDFGVETNLPMDSGGLPNPSWNPSNSNPISYPQNMNGFGHIKSNYMLLQVGLSIAYKINEKFSIGLAPTFNYGSLEIAPNPTTAPDPTKGYPEAEAASTTGVGGQIGLFYDSGVGLKIGAAYKTKQNLSELEFKNTYLDGSTAPSNKFDMDFPSILSLGVGYSNNKIDLAVDYRIVNYENTNGFSETGWVIAEEGMYAGYPTGAVKGFGWKNIFIISTGLQYKGIDKLPLRIGYTYSSNPIDEEVAFYSVSAPAVITNAFQFGLTYEMSDKMNINAVYHHGISNGKTEGTLLNPRPAEFGDGPWNATNNPLGIVPGTKVGYEMSTNLIMLGISYSFGE